jgi:hypothetical protein
MTCKILVEMAAMKNIVDPPEKEEIRKRIQKISGSNIPYKAEVEKFDGFVAFLDVLGTKNRISMGEEETDEMINELIGVAEKTYNQIEWMGRSKEIKIIALSDCYIVVCKDSSFLKDFLTAVSITAWYALSEFDKPMMIRGAIAKGKVWLCEENVVITGEAYMRAYQMEENDTIYPRIIFSEGLSGRMNEIPHVCDRDGAHSLDYIKISRDHFQDIECDCIEIIIEKLEKEREQSRKQEEKIVDDNNLSLRKKQSWLIEYLIEA